MIIKEFLPNPAGNDKEGEYLKIFNDGETVVFLNGWVIKDAAGKTFKLSGSLEAGQELLLPSSQTKISLNNNGENIVLYDVAGKLVDELAYTGQAKEGQIINKLQLTIDKMTNDLNSEESISYPIPNYQFLITKEFLFLDFLTAAILAALGLYIVLRLEKKLDIKLF